LRKALDYSGAFFVSLEKYRSFGAGLCFRFQSIFMDNKKKRFVVNGDLTC
jgi:hypothetical protein